MSNSKFVFTILGLALSSSLLAAEKPAVAQDQVNPANGSDSEVLVTQSSQKGKASSYGLDFVSDGNAIAFEFTVQFPEGADMSKVSIANCASQLPASHTGKCLANPKTRELLVMVYSMNNAKLPAGIVSVGNVSYSGMLKSQPTVVKALAVDDQIREYAISGRLD
jgi:hypothetical protein